MWVTWVKCRYLCDMDRASAPNGTLESCLMAMSEDIFRECIKMVWGPKHYEATLRKVTMPLPTDASKALGHLQEINWNARDNDDSGDEREAEEPDESQLELIWN